MAFRKTATMVLHKITNELASGEMKKHVVMTAFWAIIAVLIYFPIGNGDANRIASLFAMLYLIFDEATNVYFWWNIRKQIQNSQDAKEDE